jgi:alpha-galactosidase
VTVEACSGGGGRIDAAVLALSDVVWPSDETGPRDRAAIQHGFLTAYGPHVMSSWVTDEPDRLDTEPASFEYRFVVAMAGVFGIGSDLLAWTGDQRSRATELVDLYRSIRTTIHTGRVELHGVPTDPVHAVEYGSADQTVLLVYGRAARNDRVVLNPKTVRTDRTYRIVGTDQRLSGADAQQGVVVPFSLAPDADVIIFEALP